MKINFPFGLTYCKSYYITHPYCLLQDLYYGVKHFIQRGLRGYSDSDSWSLGYYLNRWMPEAVRSLKGGHGFPLDLVEPGVMNPVTSAIPEDKDDEYFKLWQEKLETIAQGFEAAKKLQDLDYDYLNQAENERLKKQMHKGLGLFCKHYLSLWD